MKAGNEIVFRAQDQDYSFNLRGSNAALNRLLDCVDRYSKTASTNPFGSGAGGQQNNGGGQGSQGFDSSSNNNNNGNNSQQGGGDQQAGNNSMKLKSLTRSADDVRQFLVDVTGARPSMISVEPNTFKSGAPYFHFSTPIGQGDFWPARDRHGQLLQFALSG